MIKYETIKTIQLDSSNTILTLHNMPELVHLDDPAFTVMLDFCQTPALTLNENTSTRDAQNEMEFHGTHLMTVIDDKHHIKGLLTAEDLLGEKPIKVTQEMRITRDEIPVRMLMTKLKYVPAFNITSVEKTRVGNILKTLHELDSPFALVVRVDNNGEKILRGCFTTAQISRQLHHNVRKRIHDVDSVSELKDWKK